MNGNLTIKETTISIEIPFSAEYLSEGKIRLRGESEITRSDYLLDFGVMNGLVSDAVQITFDVIILLKEE